MARGVSREPVPYVLEADRGLKREEQTIFYVRPRTGKDQNFITSKYLNAYIEKEDKKSLDIQAANIADVETFKNQVSRIENFCFSDEYYEQHPAVKNQAVEVLTSDDKKALYVSVIETPDMVADVCRDLDAESFKEIVSVSNNITKLEEGRKK